MSPASNSASVCLAVLPFENLSGNAEYDYFASGFVEDLITDLSHFSSLQVISSYTSRKMGGRSKDTLAVANEFSINYLHKGIAAQKLGDCDLD